MPASKKRYWKPKIRGERVQKINWKQKDYPQGGGKPCTGNLKPGRVNAAPSEGLEFS